MENNMNIQAAQSAAPVFKTYTKKERNIYLIGLAGQNIIYNIIGACLMYYLQFTLLIPAIAVGMIFAFARIWDALNDPIMGTIVDRTRTKIGKCRPYLLAVPIPIMIITILCFTSFGFYDVSSNPDKLLNGGLIAWAAVTYILWGMTYTIGDIPLWGVTALMTESDKDRNKLLSLARLFGGLGGGVVILSMQSLALAAGNMVASAANLSAAEGERWGFLIVAGILAIIGTIMFQLTGFAVKERIPPSDKKNSLLENFKVILKNKPFSQILLSGILGSAKMVIMLAAIPLVTYYYASKNALFAFVFLALLGGGLFIGQFVGMALTPKMLTVFSKKNLYNWSNLLSIPPYILLFVVYLIAPHTLTSGFWVAICFVLFMVAGATGGVTTVLQSTMIADCVDYEEYKNGTRPDALFFSGQTFIAKLQSGIATIMATAAYAIVKFSDARVAEVNAFISAGGIPRLTEGYSSFMMILFLIVSILPAVGCFLSVLPTWKYALDDKEHKRILAELNLRRAEKESIKSAEEEQ
jgi:sugar (glycoside-pentoside-hexuronide) transporter